MSEHHNHNNSITNTNCIDDCIVPPPAVDEEITTDIHKASTFLLFSKINLLDIPNFNVPYGNNTFKPTEQQDVPFYSHIHSLFIKNTPFIFSTALTTSSLVTSSHLTFFPSLPHDFLSQQLNLIFTEHLRNTTFIQNEIDSKSSAYDNYLTTSYYTMNIGPLLPGTCELSRDCYVDGDSFYRAFMFSYIECQLSQRNELFFMNLIYDIHHSKQTFVNKDYCVNYNEVLLVLKHILTRVKDKSMHLNELLYYYNKMFSMLDNFNKALIKYMKIKLAMFLKDNAKAIDVNAFVNNKCISSYYINATTNAFVDVDAFINEHIALMQHEPEPFTLFLVPFAFPGVELTITPERNNEYINTLVFPRCTSYTSDNSTETGMNNVDIALVYASTHHYKIKYTEQRRIELNYTAVPRCSMQFTSHKDIAYTCDTCNKQQGIIFNKFNEVLCKNCLYDKVKHIMMDRLRYLKNEHYYNIEYYSRPIQLTTDNDKQLELNDNEIRVLFIGNNITSLNQLLLFYARATCSKCGVVYDNNDNTQSSSSSSSELITLNCGCILCKHCSTQLVKDGTLEHIVLNAFEKKKFNILQQMCACNKPFDVYNAVQLLYPQQEVEEYNAKAHERMEDYLYRYCMLCERKLADKNKKVEERVVRVCVQGAGGKVKHTVCERCVNAFGENKGNVNGKYVKVECKVCTKEHLVSRRMMMGSECCSNCVVW